MAIGRINATLSGVQPGGLAKIVPTSVAVGSGSGSVNANGTVTFSGASSISLNNVFTSSYTNYLVLYRQSSANIATSVFRLRASGTDNTASQYGLQQILGVNTSVTGVATTVTSVDCGSNGREISLVMNLFGPQEAAQTVYKMDWNGKQANNTGIFHTVKSGYHEASTSFDGLTIFSDQNNTGFISVYGYN